MNRFPTVKRQLYDDLISEFGDQAEFIIGSREHPAVLPRLEVMRFEFQELEETEVRPVSQSSREVLHEKRNPK